MNVIYYVLAAASGAALASQVALNGKLRAHVGSPMQATCVSLCVGAVAALAVSVVARDPLPSRSAVAAAPWRAWCGGMLGVVYLWATVVSTPRLGVAATFGLVVTGQIVTAMALDHFGLLDVPINPVTARRLLGAGMVVAGVAVLSTAK